MVAVAPNGAIAVTYVDADDSEGRIVRIDSDRVHQKVMEKIAKGALGVTPEYIGAMRAAVPGLARVDADEFASLRAVGVTPDFARWLATAGLPRLAWTTVQARAVGVTGDYVRGLRAAGVAATWTISSSFGRSGSTRRSPPAPGPPDRAAERGRTGRDASARGRRAARPTPNAATAPPAAD